MAVRQMFSVFDSKAAAYLEPFFAPTRGVAMRSFQAACQDHGHNFHKYAEDYTLFHLGEFDEFSGEVRSLNAPEMVISAHQVVALMKADGNA